MPTTHWTMILIGCAGGLIPDVLRIIKNRYEPKVPEYLRSVTFWLGLLLLVIMGGLAAWLGEAANVKQALAYGFAAPEFISRILSGGEAGADATQGGGKLSLREWWKL
jgi:hypothetical protein